MATDINNVVLCGRLTRDCGTQQFDFGYTQNGTCVAKISIAVNRSKKQADGTYANEADFYDVTIFGKIAESLKNYLTKGKQVIVQGHLSQEKWTDSQTGQNRSKVIIIADNVQLIGGQTQQSAQQQFAQPQQQFVPQQQNVPQPQSYQTPLQNAQNQLAQSSGFTATGYPEDIPF